MKLVKEYIRNVEEGKETIKKVESSVETELQVADDVKHEYFIMYNYVSSEQLPINPGISGIFYESPSISKLLNIVNKYI